MASMSPSSGYTYSKTPIKSLAFRFDLNEKFPLRTQTENFPNLSFNRKDLVPPKNFFFVLKNASNCKLQRAPNFLESRILST